MTLSHTHSIPQHPKRVVVLGSAGFVGKNICDKLEASGVDVLRMGRKECDLESSVAAAFLESVLRPDDHLIFISAKAPVKNTEMLLQNIVMAKQVCDALKKKPVKHVLYISSDAVYADSTGLLSETSSAEPASLHGAMHLTREVMLKNEWSGSLAILRPTLIYGVGDPHNGYGPNRFARLARQNSEIALFGEGEERRDHIYVGDVAELAIMMARHESKGTLNAVTGRVISFREIAQIIVEKAASQSPIKATPRVGSMPHNGYRAFDAGNILEAFPDFKITKFEDGIREYFEA